MTGQSEKSEEDTCKDFLVHDGTNCEATGEQLHIHDWTD